MKRNKIGSIFMVSVLALAGIGISYAGFYDEINVYGYVQTGTVDIELVGWFSGTWVWKVYICDEYEPIPPPGNPKYYNLTEEILIYQGFTQNLPSYTEIYEWAEDSGLCLYYVADAVAYEGYEDDEVGMSYYNLFPCIDFCADFIFHYEGSIPAKINEMTWWPNIYNDTQLVPGTDMTLMEWLFDYNMNNPGYGAWFEFWTTIPFYNDTGVIIGWDPGYLVPLGHQLHYCDYIMVKICIHLPQLNILQGLYGSFGARIGVIQWNDLCIDNGPV